MTARLYQQTTAVLAGSAVACVTLAATSPAHATGPTEIGASVAVAPATRADVPRPAIINDPIPYPATRKAQMAAYAQRHYGNYTNSFAAPKQVVLHFTVTRNYPSTWSWMAANSASPGNAGTKKEKPGACTHFVIGKNGKIYQLAPLNLMCRHVVGLNDVAVGIEFVEMTSAKNIINRPKQLAAGRTLVRWLQSEYSIRKSNVIGHAMANKSPYFRDLKGWYNDHSDWPAKHVKVFRRGILS